MKSVYWLLPILIAQFQVVPFILLAFILFLTPLKDVIQTEVLSEIYMFWFFNLLFILPAMVVSSYAYLFIVRCKCCRQNRVLISTVFVLVWCLLLQALIAVKGYFNPINACAVLVIMLFYMMPLVLCVDIVNKKLQGR